VSSVNKILSAGLVIVHHDGSRFRFLVLRAYRGWDFPKAPVSGAEDPLRVATRAARDATGIEELDLNWGDEHRETVPHEDGSVSRYYIAQSKTMDVELSVPADAGSADDYEFRWVTADEAEDVLPPRLGIVLDWAVRMLLSGTRST
jgi:bis(5'-nucleosidyl)-tetraphosphatase